MDLKQKIGLRVRAARTNRKLTQEQLAEKIDKTVETVSNIERGRTLPALDTLERLGRVLSIPLREFFGEEEKDDPRTRKRTESEFVMIEMLRSLPDEDLAIAVGLVRVLSEGRQRIRH